MPRRKPAIAFEPSAPPANELSDWSRFDCAGDNECAYYPESPSSADYPSVDWTPKEENAPESLPTQSGDSSCSYSNQESNYPPYTTCQQYNMQPTGPEDQSKCGMSHKMKKFFTKRPCCSVDAMRSQNFSCSDNRSKDQIVNKAALTKAFYITPLMAEKCFEDRYVASVVREMFLLLLITITAYFVVFQPTNKCEGPSLSFLQEPITIEYEKENNSLDDLAVDVIYTFDQITSTALIWGFVEKITQDFVEQENDTWDAVSIGKPKIWKILGQEALACKLPFEFQGSFKNCLAPYRTESEYTKPIISPCLEDGLRRHSNSVSIIDDCGTLICNRLYGGGGYVEILSSNCTVEKLKEGKWIDRSTRAVLMSSAKKNPSAYTVSMLQLMFEISPSTAVTSSYQSSSMQVKSYIYGNDFVTLAFEVFLFLCYFLFVFHFIREIAFLGKYSICVFWIIVEFIILIVGLAILVVTIVRFAFLQELGDINQKKDIKYPLYLDSLLMHFNATLLLLLSLKLLQMLTVMDTFNVIFCAIKRGFLEILKVMIILWIILIAFALMAFVIFGQTMGEFKSLFDAFISVHLFIFGGLKIDEMCPGSFIGPFFVILMYNLAFFLLVFILATLAHYFSQIKCTYTSSPCRIPCHKFCICQDCVCMCPKKKPKVIKVPPKCPSRKACRVCCPNIPCAMGGEPDDCPEDQNLARYMYEIVSKYQSKNNCP